MKFSIGLTDGTSAAATCPFGRYLTFLKSEAIASRQHLLGGTAGTLHSQNTE